jgi:hypothetical protein
MTAPRDSVKSQVAAVIVYSSPTGWAALMARQRRKTLVVCHPCHDVIHHGQPAVTAA